MVDPRRVYTGNAIHEGKKGWFVGQFNPPDRGLVHQTSLELKWGQHQKGEKRLAFSEYKTATTFSILISGIFKTKMMIDGSLTEITLRTPGDYLAFGPLVSHCWEAVEDCVVLSIRFPSVAGDMNEVPELNEMVQG